MKAQFLAKFVSCRKTFAIGHPDFHARNILLDDDWNVTRILDWSGVKMVPVELFCNVPGGWYIISSSEQKERLLRTAFLRELQKLEAEEDFDSSTSEPLSEIFESAEALQSGVFSGYYVVYENELFALACREASLSWMNDVRRSLMEGVFALKIRLFV